MYSKLSQLITQTTSNHFTQQPVQAASLLTFFLEVVDAVTVPNEVHARGQHSIIFACLFEELFMEEDSTQAF